tara:strand:+ start:130 stop:468 length:339 start_codon:yes stop_codon:yes gene_type:complete
MKKLLYKFWQGEITLWKSYWLFGEILNAIFLFLLLNLEIYMFKNTSLFNNVLFFDFRNLTILSKIIIIIWTLFITVGVWRSAEKYKGNIIWVILTLLFLSYRVFTLRLIFFS